MFDPKAFLDAAVKRMSHEDKEKVLRDMVARVVDFIDHHSILVPEMKVSAGNVEVMVTVKRLDPVPAEPAPAPAKEPDSGGNGE